MIWSKNHIVIVLTELDLYFVTFIGVCTKQTCFLISFLISREQNLNYRAIL